MALNLFIEDNKFRVITQGFQTNWLPDTPGNRKVAVIFLRNLQNEKGKALFTLQELSVILESENRQAASQHLEEFRECGEDFYETLKRRQKVDEEVTKAVLDILKEVPLEKIEEIARRVNEKLNRDDIASFNVEKALEQISVRDIRRILKKQLSCGQAHYKEEYLMERLFAIAMEKEPEKAPGLPPEVREQWKEASRPTGLYPERSEEKSGTQSEQAEKLFEGEVNQEKLSSIWDSALGWKMWAFVLYFHGVSLSSP